MKRFILWTIFITGITWMNVSSGHAQSPDAPGLSFDLSAAIAAATPGQTIRVPPGTYSGPLTLDKPLALVADGQVVIRGTGEGNIITITAPDVTVRGFTLRRTGDSNDHPNAGVFVSAPRAIIENNVIEDALFGVYVNIGTDSIIRGNTIRGKLTLAMPRRGDAVKLWFSHGVIVENNTVTDCRDMVLWYSNNLQVRGNHVSRGRYGLHFMYAENAIVEDNVLSRNSVGVFLMYSRQLELNRNIITHNRGPSGFGLGLKDVDGVDCHDNAFVDNRVGIHFDNSPSRVELTHHFYRNVIAFNDIGLGFLPSVHDNHFSDNSMLDNIEQIAVFGGGELAANSFTVNGRGNYWSDYRGYDANGDGIGDVTYHAQSIFENLMDQQPNLRLFLFSPAQQAVELASRAFPIVKPKIRATDTAPLMKPVEPNIAALAKAGAWSVPAIITSIGLLGAGLFVVLCARRELKWTS